MEWKVTINVMIFKGYRKILENMFSNVLHSRPEATNQKDNVSVGMMTLTV